MDPSNSSTRDDVGERMSINIAEPDLFTPYFAGNLAAAGAAKNPLSPGFGSSWGLFGDMIDFDSPPMPDPTKAGASLGLLSDSDPDAFRVFEQAATRANENCFNSRVDSMDSGIHCHYTGSGGAEAVNSSRQVSSYSFNHGRNDFHRSRKQEQRSINLKLSQGASCSTLRGAIGDEDEIQSASGANKDGEELESDSTVPRVGKVFNSEKEVYDFYSNFAKIKGFNVRRGKAEYSGSDKSVIKAKCFLCSCQGHKSKQQIDKQPRYTKQNTRTGCDAMIKCVVHDGTWKISKVVLEHNHDLKGSFDGVQGRGEGLNATASLSMGKSADEISKVNYSDVSQGTRKSCPMPESDGTQELIDYFKNMQIEDPFFFYTVQVEAAQGMVNFFWRDSRSKVDYMHFGDVLVLDTMTRINKLDDLCAVFWGRNHHRQDIIFGWAAMVNQTVGSVTWLLQSFLEAMSWQKPRTIITDVSEEIANALTDILPETRHCLRARSILNSFDKYLSPLIDQVDQPGLRDLFSECVFHVQSQEEFESKWKSLIGKSKLHEETWFASLHRMREKWSHAFTKNAFTAGLLSIENNENAHAIFGNLFCKTMTLYQIALRCGEAAKYIRVEELKEDRCCEKAMENFLKSKSPMEKEAERLYTRPIFRMFQQEFINSLSLAIEESGATATLSKFKLTEAGSAKIDTVEFDPANLTVACSCGKFESDGILCFHALKVLNSKNIFKIPSRYLLTRWTKSAKDNLPVDVPNKGIAHYGNPVKSFYSEFMQKASQVAHKCETKKRRNIALTSLSSAWENIAKAPRTEEFAIPVEDSDGNDAMGQTI